MDPAVSERQGTTRLGSFEVVRKLTRGGMAEIFLARTRGPSGFEKLVVLKKILPKYAGRQRYVQLFLDEARLAASLDHPNIVHVYDIGMVDGSYFFTMEYLHGQDVRTMLHRAWRTGERFPIEDAVQVARNVASALHFAHEKQRDDGSLLGIVHRDVSPSNIIVTYDGATKLLDFGVAKTTTSSVKTRTGTLKGKVAYMSPEQARGTTLDRRSDIFSLGIVLWEMVTTQRLYRMENDLATLQAIITQPAKSPTTLRPDCPAELERIVLRALAREPADRYQTAEQLVSDLDELARDQKLKQTPSALAQTLAQLFAPEVTAWREARAAGVPLADHLHTVAEAAAPASESDFVAANEDDDEDDDDEDDIDDLYELDDDDDDDDDDLTEHAAPIVDPLPPLRESRPELSAANGDVDTVMLRPISPSGIHATPSRSFPKVAGPAATPNQPIPSITRSAPQGTPGPLPVTPPTTIGRPPISAGPPTVPTVTVPTVTVSTVTVPTVTVPTLAIPVPPRLPSPMLTPPPMRTPTLDALDALRLRSKGSVGPDRTHELDATEAAATPHLDEPSPREARDPSDLALDDERPIDDPDSSPPTILGVAPGHMTPVPGVQAARFGVPPWQSGQAGQAGQMPPRPESLARSWQVVELPPIDPTVFERQRHLVVRVASGVIAFILLIAILAGHC